MKVSNITNRNNKKVKNQFIITDYHKKGNMIEYFQSYDSIIVKRIYDNEVQINGFAGTVVKTYLDSKYYNYSTTTSKYRNIFLEETTKDIEKKMKDGIYILTNLN